MKFTWLFSERFYVAGYGSNFGSLSSLTPVQAVNKNACQVKRYTLLNRALVHNCDTGSGNSGSPLFTYINGLPYIVGVHFGGISDQDNNVGCKETWLPEECENYATKTNIFLKAMKEIISEN